MSLTCSIMQPTYFPWLGYFALIDSADKFVFYNDVQFVKQSWHSRNRIKTSNGVIFISIPLLKSDLGTPINSIKIDNRKTWQKKQLKTLFYTYQKAPFFKQAYPFFEAVLQTEHNTLDEINMNIIKEICFKIGCDTQFYSSSLMPASEKNKDARLVEICKEIDCDAYISPLGSAQYIEENEPGGELTKNGITLYYQNYAHPIYHQEFGKFEPYMSIVDLIFNVGFENTLEVVRSGRRSFLTSDDVNK